jgi:hypothetical protein
MNNNHLSYSSRCGVFGCAWFPTYKQIVAQAYKEVLSENDYGFKAVVFSEISPQTIQIFYEIFSKPDCKPKIPVIITKCDILQAGRMIANFYPTSVHNAGDLWEFGQVLFSIFDFY